MERLGPGPGSERDRFEDEPLREEDVTAADRLDDRVQETDLPGDQKKGASDEQ